MDRRSFFRSAIDKCGNAVGKTVVKAADASAKKKAALWLRPPFAINELEFLLACTRCSDCITACPHDVIFSLSARVGARATATPALDLLNKGCHLCEDWPCVTACKANALCIPDQEVDAINESNENKDEKTEFPRLAKATVDTTSCLPYNGPECGACIDSCPVENALTLDMVKPIINEMLCTGCALCREACIAEPKAIKISSL